MTCINMYLNINILYICLNLFLYYILIEKYNIGSFITTYANRINSKFLYELSQCKFCLNFHLSVIFFVVFSIITLTININSLLIYFILWMAIKLK